MLLLDILLDTLIDAAKMLPFLYFACLLVELAEHRRSARLMKLLSGEGKVGFFAGALLGAVPQCGFSAMAANLYAGGVITLGTLLSVFIATSDEAFLVLLSDPSSLPVLAKLLVIKLVLAMAAGFAVDFALHRPLVKAGLVAEHEQVHCPCEHDEGEENIWKAAALHALEVLLYVVLFSFLIHLALESFAGRLIAGWLAQASLLQPLLAALIGLIPNCAASVLLTQLYLAGTISFASLVAGLSSAAGVGLMVLYRSRKNVRANLAVTGLLLGISVLGGVIVGLLGL